MALFETPEGLDLGLLFQLKLPLVVDPYQRDYAWTFHKAKDDDSNQGEVADFIYDLKRLIDEGTAESHPTPYFFTAAVERRAARSSARLTWTLTDLRQ